MSYYVFMKAKQFLKKLKHLGVEIVAGRGKGGHYLAKYKGRQSTIPVHGDADISPVFIKVICKQLGIDPKDL